MNHVPEVSENDSYLLSASLFFFLTNFFLLIMYEVLLILHRLVVCLTGFFWTL